MAKVVCKRCESDKIVVVNEMIEQPDKEGSTFFGFLYLLGIIGIIIGLYVACIYSPIIIGLSVFGYSLLFLICIGLFRLLQPFRYKNKTKCICLDCGHTWYLGEDKPQNKNLLGE